MFPVECCLCAGNFSAYEAEQIGPGWACQSCAEVWYTYVEDRKPIEGERRNAHIGSKFELEELELSPEAAAALSADGARIPDDWTEHTHASDDPMGPPAYGFVGPEEGAEERYRRRQRNVPWVRHTLWWVLHNCVAHPLIGVCPLGLAFDFHDWTSRRMHGRR